MLAPDGTLINKGAARRASRSPATPRAHSPAPPPAAAAKDRITDAAASFPWPPPSLAEALGPSFVNEHDERVSLSALTAAGTRYIGLYFGAAWCGPCRAFKRRLVEAYEGVLREGGSGGLEVVYVSSDQSEAEADTQRRTSPWLSLPYAERWRRDALWCVRRRGARRTAAMRLALTHAHLHRTATSWASAAIPRSCC
jgi:thiol-disulfide isomerase/thioredoxin